jgi:hypothetical protein
MSKNVSKFARPVFLRPVFRPTLYLVVYTWAMSIIICFNNERKSLLPHNLTTKPNIDKFKELLNSDSYNMYCKIAKFCKIV